MHRSHNVNESVAYFEEHPELKLDGNVVEVLVHRRKEPGDDVAGVVEDVEEIAIPVPRIPTQMVERTAEVPQIPTVQQPVLMAQVTTEVVE